MCASLQQEWHYGRSCAHSIKKYFQQEAKNSARKGKLPFLCYLTNYPPHFRTSTLSTRARSKSNCTLWMKVMTADTTLSGTLLMFNHTFTCKIPSDHFLLTYQLLSACQNRFSVIKYFWMVWKVRILTQILLVWSFSYKYLTMHISIVHVVTHEWFNYSAMSLHRYFKPVPPDPVLCSASL